MSSGDILYDALTYALIQTEGPVAPVAVVNATGREDASFVTQSSNACYNLKNTLNGVFNTILIRATRQMDETLGLVALAAAHAAPDGHIYIAQENHLGAPGLEKHLRRAWGDDFRTISKFKCRTMVLPVAAADAATLQRWTEAASIRKVKHNRGEFWSAPGVFSWDRPDSRGRLLLAHLPPALSGRVADLGCGNGLLSGAILKKEGASELYALDADARAVECCRLNLQERGEGGHVPFHVLWRDVTGDLSDLPVMDAVVMNPPFHTAQEEDRALGQAFCSAALKMLRSGGELYLVANRHMPYEAILENEASAVTLLADTDGFKIIRAAAR